MIKASFKKYDLHFKQPSGTSRGILRHKTTYFLQLSKGDKLGLGECGLFKGLSADDVPDYEDKLQWLCHNCNEKFDDLFEDLKAYPSIQFGLEQAFLSLKSIDKFVLFPSEFTNGKAKISINGLIWMGSKDFMSQQIKEKLKAGFTTIKLKIGAIDFQSELDLLKYIRSEFSHQEIEIRVDANGAFTPKEALEKLKRLSDFELHSIEQPIKANQWEAMANLCSKTPLPIALDEELIGVFEKTKKEQLLREIKPQYIILKPSLIGGFKGSNKWISLAEKQNIGWWITSALESNIGLNAIAQFTYSLKNKLPQGLGTGGLFTNNLASPLEVNKGALFYNNDTKWDLSPLNFN
ncbi:MAG: o-succinylbenzoate synthase [Flavobacteriaceae bacterium]|nr:o-succinylbenzoate synthase [Flavobacteriaceae bacterium]